jgi:hypothetical protein
MDYLPNMDKVHGHAISLGNDEDVFICYNVKRGLGTNQAKEMKYCPYCGEELEGVDML